MQLVSRKVLDQLARGSGQVVEADSSFSYSEFVAEYQWLLGSSKRD